MIKRIFVLILVAVFVFVQTGDVFARRGGSFGRSFSRSWGSSSKSSGGSAGGWFGSSSSSKSNSSSSGSSKSGWFGSSSSGSKSSGSGYSGSSSNSGYSGSSSGRSIPGSYSSGKSSTGATRSYSNSSTAKSSYMQDTYKKEVSKNNYQTYKQKLNSQQQKVYNDSMNRSYRINNRMNFEDAMRTRPDRIRNFNSRPIFVNVNPVFFGSPFSYGYAFVGPWDLWFLMRASEMFWYHHWLDIHPHRDYFNAQEFARLEARVKELEKQNIKRDPSYVDPNVDPDLQFSSDYQQKHLNGMYESSKYPQNAGNPVATLIMIAVIVIILIIIIRAVSKPRRKNTPNSRLY